MEKEIKYQDGVPYEAGTIVTVCGAVQGFGCGKVIRIVDGEGIEGVSHGICPECRTLLEESSENSKWLKARGLDPEILTAALQPTEGQQ